jgi:hypothetical protein
MVPRPASIGGAYRDRHGRGKRDAMDVKMLSALARTKASPRTAKSCGPDSPMLGSTPGSRARGDGGQEAGAPRRPRISRNPLRRECRCSAVPVVACVRKVHVLCTQGSRVQPASGIPCALSVERDDDWTKLGRNVSRECFNSSLRGAKRRSNPYCLRGGILDCFAEPVIGRAFARPVGSQ